MHVGGFAPGLAPAALLLTCAAVVAAARPPNVLHLIADDMRPQLGAFHQGFMRTPNIDSLAAGALTFDAAYTQFAYCAPSRNSFMTGRRPERTRCLNFLYDFRQLHGDAWVAMPQFFKNAGYFTSAAGKLYASTAGRSRRCQSTPHSPNQLALTLTPPPTHTHTPPPPPPLNTTPLCWMFPLPCFAPWDGPG